MKKWSMMPFSMCAVIIAVLQVGALAWAADQIVIADFSLGVDAKGAPQGWQLKETWGKANFSIIEADGLHALVFRSTDTSFSIQKETKVDLKQYPILSWKWKVTTLPKGGDFRKSKTDDQAAQLFLRFSKTKAIVYLWDTTAPEGLMADARAPFFMSVKAVAVRSGPAELGTWLTETRNAYEDYRKLYGDGEQTPVVSGVRLQINSQHTHTSAESYFAEVIFRQP